MDAPRGLVRCVEAQKPKHKRNPCLCQGRRYTCPHCKRFVPECFGAADDHPEACDDCWAELERAKAR